MQSKVLANVETEKTFLGSILSKGENINDVKDIIQPDDLYRQEHRKIYQAMLNLSMDGQIDIVTVSDELQRMGETDKSTLLALHECGNAEHSGLYTKKYAQTILELARRRKLIDYAGEIINKSQDVSEKLDLDSFQSQINNLGTSGLDDDVLDSMTACKNLYSRMEKNATEGRSGIQTGFKELDDMIGNLNPGELVILAARPSMGKTAFALNIIMKLIYQDIPTMMYSLEMTTDEIYGRLAAMKSGVDSKRIQQSELMDSREWDAVAVALSQISEKKFYISEKSGRTATDIAASIRRLHARYGIKVAVVDHLQLVRSGRKEENRTQEIGNVTLVLKNLAKNLNIVVILLSQLSRGVELRNDKRPMMSDLRDSGEIEQNADKVLMMYRDLYYNPEGDTWTEISAKKVRGGTPGMVKMMFQPELSRFTEIAFNAEEVNEVPL